MRQISICERIENGRTVVLAFIVPDFVGTSGVRTVDGWSAFTALVEEQGVEPKMVLWPDDSYSTMVDLYGDPPDALTLR